MRVLQLGKFYPIRGGVEKVMWDLTKGLSEKGVSCDMLCARLKSGKTDPDDRQYQVGDTDFKFNDHGSVHCVRAIAKVAGTMIAPSMIGWLASHHKDYDIIHIHHPDPMAALALKFSCFRGKVVLHWHSDILSQKAWLTLYRPLQNWLIKRADVIIGTTPVYIGSSPWLRGCTKKCTVVPIGIDPIIPDKSKVEALRGRFAGKVLLLTIGRLVPYKGLSFLIDAMKVLPLEYHLIIGGGGPLEKDLKEQVAKGGLGGRITFTGFIPQEEIPAYFGACDVFILSSIMKTEAFGIVQLEAMSCGKPLVATKIPGSGVAWVNADGISGKNAEPADAESLAGAILEVSGNKEGYGKGARERYERHFTKEKMIHSILNVYENLL